MIILSRGEVVMGGWIYLVISWDIGLVDGK